MRTANLASEEEALQRKRALYKAMSHPVKFEILAILGEREASPREVSDEIGVSLKRTASLFLELRDADLIALVETDKRRGGIQHFYKKIAEIVLDTADAERLSKAEREVGSGTVVGKVFGDVAEALEQGSLDSHPARSLLRLLTTVDDEGMRRAGQLALQLVADLEAVGIESLGRLAQSGEQGMNISGSVLIFERAQSLPPPLGGPKPPDR